MLRSIRMEGEEHLLLPSGYEVIIVERFSEREQLDDIHRGFLFELDRAHKKNPKNILVLDEHDSQLMKAFTPRMRTFLKKKYDVTTEAARDEALASLKRGAAASAAAPSGNLIKI